jgi:Mg2+ and Co2+ transporter CorA
MIGEEFGLHELAIEDALHASERPKLERYATHLFLDAYAVDRAAPRASCPALTIVSSTSKTCCSTRAAAASRRYNATP